MLSRMRDDYDVIGMFWSYEEYIGSVELFENAAEEDMPFEIEINGYTYKREDTI